MASSRDGVWDNVPLPCLCRTYNPKDRDPRTTLGHQVFSAKKEADGGLRLLESPLVEAAELVAQQQQAAPGPCKEPLFIDLAPAGSSRRQQRMLLLIKGEMAFQQ